MPFVVADGIDSGRCDATVIETSAKWYGVTYHEDKPALVAFISKSVSEGEYPDGLWNK